jgi:hypothetical protein
MKKDKTKLKAILYHLISLLASIIYSVLGYGFCAAWFSAGSRSPSNPDLTLVLIIIHSILGVGANIFLYKLNSAKHKKTRFAVINYMAFGPVSTVCCHNKFGLMTQKISLPRIVQNSADFFISSKKFR